MKKILLLSDTHQYNDIFSKLNYDDYNYLIHCGDSSLQNDDPLLKNFYVVKGNHDEVDFPKKIILEIFGYRCLITHGHLFNVYASYDNLLQYMNDNNIDICFHGHTHIPVYKHIDNKIFINPGSTMFNRGSIGIGTYAVLTIDKTLQVDFFNSEDSSLISLDEINENSKILIEIRNNLNKNKR